MNTTTQPANGPATFTTPGTLTIQTVGGPTVVIEVKGLRLLVDPTFDEPRAYDLGGGRVLTKTAGPAIAADAVGILDAVLLSHDQHADNLDLAGRALLAAAPRVLTTPVAAVRLAGNAEGMSPWSDVILHRPDGGQVRVTAVPAQHGPDGTEHLTGPVTGFVLHADDIPTVYVSGDNASMEVVRSIATKFPRIDVALIFAGAAQTTLLGDAYLTLTAAQTVEASRILQHAQILPVHCDGWSHFTEHRDRITAAFADAGRLARLLDVEHGERRVVAPLDRTAIA